MSVFYKTHLERIGEDCPNCGSHLLMAIGKTNFYRLVDERSEEFGSNKRVQEKTRVPREHITQMQYCNRREQEGKFVNSAEIVANAFGVPVDYLLAPDPAASVVKCLTCGFECSRAIWDMMRGIE